MGEPEKTELEAEAFRGLIKHLQRRTDVQNIDLMNLAGFCRNCLAKWYMAAAQARGMRHELRRRADRHLRHAVRRVEEEPPDRGNSGTAARV